MAKIKIGKIPVYKGEYDNNTRYDRLNQVTYLGTTFQSIVDDNLGHPPAEKSEDGGEILYINTNYWDIVAKGIDNVEERTVTDNSMGYKILKKNKSFIEQVTEENTIYEIRYDFTLDENVTIPNNCVLKFEGGSISGTYTITGNNTGIESRLVKIFNTDITFAGTWNIIEGYPEWFGAVGDGKTDDTTAIQKTFNTFNVTAFSEYKYYYVTTTLTLPRNKSINGHRARIFVNSNFVESSIGPSVPSTTILYVQGREAIQYTEELMDSAFIKDLQIVGVQASSYGMFLGTEDKDSSIITTHGTNVNLSVVGYSFQNITILRCLQGIKIQDCWDTHFDGLIINKCHTCLNIEGQVVNCVFDSCKCYADGTTGSIGLKVDSAVYNNVEHRPEGLSFNGGFYGCAEVGVRAITGLSIHLINCIIDLNSKYGIQDTSVSLLYVVTCWIQGGTAADGIGIQLDELSTIENGNHTIIDGCYLTAYKPFCVESNQTDVKIVNCTLSGSVKPEFYNCGTFVFTNNIHDNDNIYEVLITNPKKGYICDNNIVNKSGSPINYFAKDKADKKTYIANGNELVELFKIPKDRCGRYLINCGFVTAYQDRPTSFILEVTYLGTLKILPICDGVIHITSFGIFTDNNSYHVCCNTSEGLTFMDILSLGGYYDDTTYVFKTTTETITYVTNADIIKGSVFANSSGKGVVNTTDGNKELSVINSGTFANKPLSPSVGTSYFATDKGVANVGAMIYYTGNNTTPWVYSDGTTVS